jgi:hypothetical protein
MQCLSYPQRLLILRIPWPTVSRYVKLLLSLLSGDYIVSLFSSDFLAYASSSSSVPFTFKPLLSYCAIQSTYAGDDGNLLLFVSDNISFTEIYCRPMAIKDYIIVSPPPTHSHKTNLMSVRCILCVSWLVMINGKWCAIKNTKWFSSRLAKSSIHSNALSHSWLVHLINNIVRATALGCLYFTFWCCGCYFVGNSDISSPLSKMTLNKHVKLS